MNHRPLVIYHGGCRDGFAAAVVAHVYFNGYADFVAGYYGQAPPYHALDNRHVYLLDFAYPLEQLRSMLDCASKLTILDHHKTAQAALSPWPDAGPQPEIVFDMERSGAGIAWDYFFAGPVLGSAVEDPHRPWWVNYVEDRDLWRWALPESKLINAYLGALPFTFEGWKEGVQVTREHAITMGHAIELKLLQYVAEVGGNARFGNLYAPPSSAQLLAAGERVPRGVTFTVDDVPVFAVPVPIVNAPQCDISELLAHLMDVEDSPLAVGWWQRADGLYQYSLRSVGDIDVSAFAKLWGGGGHKNAAGFQVPTIVHRGVGR